MMVSDETAQRIAVALERLVTVLQQIELVAINPRPHLRVVPDPNQCPLCGITHLPGVVCPKLMPQTIA